MVVVDRFSKYCHLGSLPEAYSAKSVATFFTTDIVRLHDIPKKKVSDRDKVFLSRFWQELLKQSGTSIHMSSEYHPQMDGQTEIVNKTIEGYLRATVQDNPCSWRELLPWAELWYDTAFHHSLGTTPFEIVYGRPLPSLAPYRPGDSSVEAVDQELHRRQQILKELKTRLISAQDRMEKGRTGNFRKAILSG